MRLTPTQFIREAALRTGTVPTPNGKAVQYADLPLVPVPNDICWLCGGATNGKGKLVGETIKGTFLNHDWAREPASGSLCAGCVFCLSYRELRNYSILATEQGLVHPGRANLKRILLTPPNPPFVICVAVSGQKHLHFRARVSYTRDIFPVQFEETLVWVEPCFLKPLVRAAEELCTIFAKEEVKTGRYFLKNIRRFGLKRFREIEGRVAPHRGTRLFDLAVFVT